MDAPQPRKMSVAGYPECVVPHPAAAASAMGTRYGVVDAGGTVVTVTAIVVVVVVVVVVEVLTLALAVAVGGVPVVVVVVASEATDDEVVVVSTETVPEATRSGVVDAGRSLASDAEESIFPPPHPTPRTAPIAITVTSRDRHNRRSSCDIKSYP